MKLSYLFLFLAMMGNGRAAYSGEYSDLVFEFSQGTLPVMTVLERSQLWDGVCYQRSFFSDQASRVHLAIRYESPDVYADVVNPGYTFDQYMEYVHQMRVFGGSKFSPLTAAKSEVWQKTDMFSLGAKGGYSCAYTRHYRWGTFRGHEGYVVHYENRDYHSDCKPDLMCFFGSEIE